MLAKLFQIEVFALRKLLPDTLVPHIEEATT